MTDKIRLPSSEGGLVRYFDDEYKGVFVLKPMTVILACTAIIIALIIIHAYS